VHLADQGFEVGGASVAAAGGGAPGLRQARGNGGIGCEHGGNP
jgi:hypothetical protein